MLAWPDSLAQSHREFSLPLPICTDTASVSRPEHAGDPLPAALLLTSSLCELPGQGEEEEEEAGWHTQLPGRTRVEILLLVGRRAQAVRPPCLWEASGTTDGLRVSVRATSRPVVRSETICTDCVCEGASAVVCRQMEKGEADRPVQFLQSGLVSCWLGNAA